MLGNFTQSILSSPCYLANFHSGLRYVVVSLFLAVSFFAAAPTANAQQTLSVTVPEALPAQNVLVEASGISPEARGLVWSGGAPYAAKLDTGGLVSDVAVAGGYAYLTNGSDLLVVDISNDDMPMIVGSVDVGGAADFVEVTDGFAYVLATIVSNMALVAIDITNPSDPQITDTLLPIDNYSVSGMAIGDGYLYMAGSKGLVYDVSISGFLYFDKEIASLAGSYDVGFPDFDESLAYGIGYYGLRIVTRTPFFPIPQFEIIGACTACTGSWGSGLAFDGDYAYATNGADLMVIDISNTSAPTLITTLVLPGATGGVAATSGRAYVAGDAGLYVVDISDPTTPVLIDTVGTPDSAYRVDVNNDVAAITHAGSGLITVDISEPLIPPAPAGNLATPGDYASGVDLADGYAYVADAYAGLHTVDIRNPSNPVIIRTVDTPHAAFDVRIVGDYLYVADGTSGLQVIHRYGSSITTSLALIDSAQAVDVADGFAYIADAAGGLHILDTTLPYGPVIVGHVDTPGSAEGVDVINSFAYVADDNAGLQVIDISNPAAPIIVDTLDALGEAEDVHIANGYAYVVGNGLKVLDISTPSAPVLVGELDSTVNTAGVTVLDGYAYVANGFSGGISMVDISTPSSPELVATVTTPGHAASVVVDEGYAYVGDQVGGFRVLDVSTPGLDLSPVVVGSVAMTRAYDVDVANGYAYVADEDAGLQVVDISTPSDPEIVQTLTTMGSNARAVSVASGHAFVVDGSLQVVDITTPSSPVIVGTVVPPPFGSAPSTFTGVSVFGDYAYVTDYIFGLQVVDVSTPSAPVTVGAVGTGSYTRDVDVAGDYAYVAALTSGLKVIDIRSPSAPALVGSVDTTEATGVVVSGGYAYVSDRADGLRIIDIGNPSAPVIVATIDTPGLANGVSVAHGYAYVADSDSGVHVVDISEPLAPVLVDTLITSGSAYGVNVSNGYVYVANLSEGVQVVAAAIESLVSWESTSAAFIYTPNHLPAAPYEVTLVNPDGTVFKSAGGALTLTEAGATFPAVVIDSPPDGVLVNSPDVTVSGTAADAWEPPRPGDDYGISDVTVNGVAANGGTADRWGVAHWTSDVSLIAGENLVRVAATDGSDYAHQSVADITVNYIPFVSDADGDGLDDAFELSLGTNPDVADTDGDGVNDGQELSFDGDGSFFDPANDINPQNFDTDGDGIRDGDEIVVGTDPLDDTSLPVVGDINFDGLIDLQDLHLAQQILSGEYTPSDVEQRSWDVAPLVSGVPQPDQVNNLGDYFILQQRVLGIVEF